MPRWPTVFICVLGIGCGLWAGCKSKDEIAREERAEKLEARSAEMRQKREERAKLPALVVKVNEKPVLEVARGKEQEILSGDFQVESNPIKMGVSLKNLFERNQVKIGGEDQVMVRGRPSQSFQYAQILRDEIGLVLTRDGRFKLVSQKDPKLKIRKVKSIEIARQVEK